LIFFEEPQLNIHKLDKLLNPHRIALIGVTINPSSVGGIVLRNLVGGGFRGVVYPVSPSAEAIMGVPCYSDISSLPRTPDLAIICTPAEQVPGIVEQCGEAGILGVIIMSAGFKETGEDGLNLERRISAALKKYDVFWAPTAWVLLFRESALMPVLAKVCPGRGMLLSSPSPERCALPCLTGQ
jgi:predicted CoA-binding protein